MSFVSYAQNFEDVMLWRALQHVENGFYIDVGASDPEEDSVTKAFYDRGWHGINIEPLPEYHKRLSDKRPRDINLAIAAGASDGELTLFDVPAMRGWASPDEAVAADYREKGFAVMALTVPVRRLAGICEEQVTGEIHFLKIDVEGFEIEVIRGMDFEKWRPWILVIEATLPNSQIKNHERWDQVLTEHKYSFAYFDGLNRYYVAEEHKKLMEALRTQPNVFDEFLTIGYVNTWEAAQQAEARSQQAEAKAQQAEAKAQQAEAKSHQAEAKAHQAEAKAHQAEAKAHQAEASLTGIQSSIFWRISEPLRDCVQAIKVLMRTRGR